MKIFSGIINLCQFSVYDGKEHWTAILTKLITEKYDFKILQQLLNTPHLSKYKRKGDFIFPEKILMENWNISSFLTKEFLNISIIFDQPISPNTLFKDLKETNLTALFYIRLSIAYSVHRKTMMLNFITFKTHLCGKCRKSYCQCSWSWGFSFMDDLVRYMTGTVIKPAACMRGSLLPCLAVFCAARCQSVLLIAFDSTSSCSLALQIIP